MPHDPRKCLDDIFQASSHIFQISEHRSLLTMTPMYSFGRASNAIFEIIGEANRCGLRKIDSTLVGRIPEHRRIVSFRNVLAHGYDSIKAGEVWQIIERDLPALMAAV